jgi:hypothetical protein
MSQPPIWNPPHWPHKPGPDRPIYWKQAVVFCFTLGLTSFVLAARTDDETQRTVFGLVGIAMLLTGVGTGVWYFRRQSGDHWEP